MIVLVAQYQVQAGRGDEVAVILTDMADRVETYESECLVYQVCRSKEDGDRFLIYEQYIDQAAVDSHRETDHFRELIVEKVIPLLLNRDVIFYDLVAG